MFVGSSKERFVYHNTLLCLVKALQGQNITLDLRNDSYTCGQIVTVDGFMNISLCSAVYCDPQGNEFFFENLFIHGRNIRYIHIPENMSIIATIKKELNKNKETGPVKKPIAKSRKNTKALQQHMQTVASLDL
ncbi:U7 snRNA-associated Sm-like protein LSm10 [Galleria mellonella]|uniref:U7 snRNA-associated Sm-like protein LSm10 n=1 Tax=Galleria mellonella TaxID=7137 RepID=A0A6J1X4D4_GALME|nr:U7 snRNA-associated Sm-like protein LSm10 [Galleria mellonella]